MGHIHVSTPFMFFAGLLIFGFIGWLVYCFTRPKTVAVPGPVTERVIYKNRDPIPSVWDGASGGARVSGAPIQGYGVGVGPVYPSAGPGYNYPATVMQPAQQVIHTDSGNGMLTGLIMGEMIAGGNHSNTIIERDHSYSSGPGYGAGVSNGASYNDSSSSSSGGLDISWGGDSSSSSSDSGASFGSDS